MNSMTGYGFKEVLLEDCQISVEIKSVNSRFLDLSVFLPPFLSPLEQEIRKTVSEKIVRGKVDLSVRVRTLDSNIKVQADLSAAKMYYEEAKKVAQALGRSETEIPLDSIINREGVLNIYHEYDVDGFGEKIKPVFEDAFKQFLDDRKREGENLKKDILEKLSVLDECASFFAEFQPQMEEKFRENITAKFREILSDGVDENRIMAEVASMVVKYTINEEIIRLKSHLAAMRTEITENSVPGKRLDFICQEANREINTIGSKNQFSEVGKIVIKAKDALENIREQAKNVE